MKHVASLPPSLGFVGAGRMALAIAEGVKGQPAADTTQVWFHDPSLEVSQAFNQRVAGAQACSSNRQVCERSQVIVLAVKPQVMPNVAAELAGQCGESLVISIAAGIPLPKLQEWLQHERVVRVMPNTPCLVGEGVSGFTAGQQVSEQDRQICQALFSSVGICVELTEPQLDAITGMSGSGPAYVFSLIEGLSDGGVLTGLPRDLATKLAIQTVLGSAMLARKSPEHPAILREQVTSPGGTTARGLQVLDDRGFRGAVIAAVQASTERAIALGKELS